MFGEGKEMYFKKFSKRINLMPNNVSVRPPEHPLTPVQVEHYEDHGYLIVKKLFNSDDLDMFRKRFVDLCNGIDKDMVFFVKDRELYKAGLKTEDYTNKIQELLYDKVYMRYSESPKVLDIISQLIGEDITAINCMLINKPPGSSRHPPHQDLYFFPFRPADKIVGVWTAIDPANVDNGCLYVVPGSHKTTEIYEHGDHLKETAQLYHGIVDEELAVPINRRVHLIMEPGDTVFFHPNLVHGSGSNRTKKCRKAMTCHYVNSNCQLIDVTGTNQELIATQLENEAQKKGINVKFNEVWKIKSKDVKGVKSNL